MSLGAKHTITRTALRTSCGLAAFVFAFGAAAHAQEEQEDEDTIVVTGSYVARDQARLSSPVEVIGAQEIAESGRVGVDDLLALNTANTGSMGGVQDLAKGGIDNRAARAANLRGLGPASTLVLLNGRRMASVEQDNQGNNYTNLAAMVPSIAVSRIETVLDGASALYGSDAIAGVMNVITDTGFEGLALQGQYTDIELAPAFILQGKIGGGDDRFHGVVSFSYEHQENLQGRDRNRTNFNNLSGASHPGSFIVNARPTAPGGGDVIIDNGVSGPINYSALYDSAGTATVQFADPHCVAPGTGGIYSGANPFPLGRCFFSYQQTNPVIPETEVALVHAAAQYQIEGGPELYAETRFYHQEANRFGVPSLPITTGSLSLPASNPFNPFGVPVTIGSGSFRVLGNTAELRLEESTLNGVHFVGGVRGDVFNGWDYDVNYVWTREEVSTIGAQTDMIALQNALNGFGGPDCRIRPSGLPDPSETAGAGNCAYYSPFAAQDETNDPRTDYNIHTQVATGGAVEYQILQGVVTGELFSLPGGRAGVALGAHLRREYQLVELDSAIINGRLGFLGKGLPGDGSRDAKAVFVEFQLPLLDTLNAQVALRHEDYDQFTTTDPKVGVNWRPLDNLSFRLSASTAFRAPALSQSVTTAATSGVGQTFDPLQVPPDPGTFRVINTVRNPNLQPEESTNYNGGVTWEPIENLRLSADYWRFEFENQIALENAQVVIDRDPNGPQVIRDGFGNMIAVNRGYFNSGSTETDGVDLRADYLFDWGSHAFHISDMASYINSYDVQIGPGQPVIDAVGRRNANNPGYANPQWRNILTVGWDYQRHSANLTMRYTDSVLNDLGVPATATPTAKIDSWTVFDAQYAIRFGAEENFEVAVGAINLTDEEPPQASFTGYLPSIHDVLGRQAYVKLSLTM